ncbi:MAG: serine/threonine-protein kinase [Planctomycetota bacterium]
MNEPPMDNERWKRVRALYESALDRPRTERRRWVEAQCGDDARLCREVLGMVSSAERAEDETGSQFLEPVASTPAVNPPAGTRIGSFVLGEALASGGMGTVYVATQEEPRRRVALKLLHRGAGSESTVRRFKFEAELLAQLEHPGIATVYEAGVHTFEDGSLLPYLAMEFVEGARDLLTCAREEQLDETERIELFLDVCAAAQHGHQSGVVHRDLKPQNILVGSDGRARVIDFGIARALGRSSAVDGFDSPETQLTSPGELVGTLGYMSPEQFEGDSRAIDTRSDVYSLGVVLHELLCGRPPHELRGLSLFELARTVREESVAPPAELARDLGWILCKALAKEPSQRYPSASELAADLERYLSNEAVEAGAPSTSYRLAKFVRRNRVPVAFASVAGLAILIGALAATFGLFEARRAGVALAAERDVAVAEAEKYGEIVDLLANMLSSVTPDADGREVKVADMLDRASVELAGVDRPEVAAPLRQVVGMSFSNLGLRERALEELEAAVALAELADPPDERLLAKTRNELSYAHVALGQPRAALDVIDRALPAARAALGPDAKQVFELIAARMKALIDLREPEAAIALAEEAIPRAEASFGRLSDEAFGLVREYGYALHYAGDMEASLEVFNDCVERAAESVGPTDGATLLMRGVRARMHGNLGQYDAAIEELTELLPLYETAFGTESSRTCALQSSLAQFFSSTGRPEEAYALLVTAVPCLESTLHPSSNTLLSARANLAGALDRLGDDESALKVRRAAWEQAERFFGPDDDRTLEHAHNAAILLLSLGQVSEALEIEEHVVPIWRESRGLDDRLTLEATEVLGALLMAARRLEEALEYFREVHATRVRLDGPDNPVTLRIHNDLTLCFAYLGRPEDALAEGERMLAIHRRAVDESDPSRVMVLGNLAGFASELDRPQLRLEYLEEAWRLCNEYERVKSIDAGITAMNAGEAMYLAGRVDDAIETLSAACDLFLEQPGTVPQYRGRTHGSLGTALAAAGRKEEARTQWTRAVELFEQTGDERALARIRERLAELDAEEVGDEDAGTEETEPPSDG